ncbi:MBL fold metallo-hydrolase [Candidatus Woesearchaeota archaeon]|nr:MBL fold metallo-hydrolase [Candidatus Woesearchaeota archaeon]
MELCVLASGSSGNSTYISDSETSILIDAGISCRRITESLSKLGKDLSEINGVFVTHEHTDHIKGLERLSKFNVPIYMNRMTYEAADPDLNPDFFINRQDIEIGSLKITPVPVSHDAANPCGFRVQNNGTSIGVFTDFGKPDTNIKKIANEAKALVLESNHDIDMLLNGPYPYHLKQRILSDKGHLSNIDAGLLLKDHASENLNIVFLAHLSRNNNEEETALNTVSALAKQNKSLKAKYSITKQDRISEIIKI